VRKTTPSNAYIYNIKFYLKFYYSFYPFSFGFFI